MARLSLSEVDLRVAALRTTVERASANLVALDDDVTRRLLDSSPMLSGTTASAWADASGRLARLWGGELALQAVLARIDHLRGTRRSLPAATLQAIVEVLDGVTVQMPRVAGEGRPTLTEGPEAVDPCTIEAAVETMSKDYDVVSELVIAVARVWGDVTNRIEGLAATVARLEEPTGRQGVTQPNELRALRQRLDEATRTARSDPLTLDLGVVDELATRVARVEESAAVAARAHEEADRDLDDLDAALREARALLQDCRTACRRSEEKIVVPEALRTALDRHAVTLEQLEEQCRRARHAEQGGSAPALRGQVDALLEDLRRLAGLAAAGLERRDELRGLLGAYRAKAQVLGLAEDAELEELYAERAAVAVHGAVRCRRGGAQRDALPQGHSRPRDRPGMTSCTQPGCTGQIESGYCDVCGRRHTEASLPGTPAHGSTGSASSVPNGSGPSGPAPCTRSGCLGTVGEDGYCDTCGKAPPGASARVPAEAMVREPVSIPVSSSSNETQETGTVRRLAASTGRTSAATGSGGRRRNLGAGMVDMPPVPERDPHEAVLDNPEVPERKRFCGRCNHAVGRARGPRPARSEGFCPHCGARYSFTPKLHEGDLVAGQYLVAGCIAHGGLGWIYLAQDMNLDGAWRVLKGLLDSGDESAMLAAMAEKQFLIRVRHPNVVRIYNFVQHDGADYIVMEYVGGLSLRELRLRHREETGEPLPLAQAIGYVLGILPALEYLHENDLLFCDFKPDNVIHTDDQLTLIDLGGVRRIDDRDSDLYGTVGYQAPEASPDQVSIASDLYTVGRTLAVLSLDLSGFQDERRYATKLPPVQDVPLFQKYDSFHRFLQKATATDPAARFQTAADMAEQLHGVLRQVVALDGGTPVAAPSTLFSAELGASPDSFRWQFLPVPAVDPADPAAGVLATLALLGADQRQALIASTPRSPELSLAAARLAIDDGDFEAAERELDTPEARGCGWRAAWWHGVLLLAQGRPADAQEFFAAVSAELPGELAPKLALAATFELGSGPDESPERTNGSARRASTEQLNAAVRYYQLVSVTDTSYASVSFGLAVAYTVLGDREAAVTAFARVPPSSNAYRGAQVALCKVRCAPLDNDLPSLEDLAATSTTLEGLDLEGSTRLPLARELHAQALAMLLDGRVVPDEHEVLGGEELTEFGQRTALERTYRQLAKLASVEEERCALIDQANDLRPRTLT